MLHVGFFGLSFGALLIGGIDARIVIRRVFVEFRDGGPVVVVPAPAAGFLMVLFVTILFATMNVIVVGNAWQRPGLRPTRQQFAADREACASVRFGYGLEVADRPVIDIVPGRDFAGIVLWSQQGGQPNCARCFFR